MSIRLLLLMILCLPASLQAQESPVPKWAQQAVWYQIFPERFYSGLKTNDPVRGSLEFPDQVPENWRISPWTWDWYRRDAWERERGPDFYEHGVFDRRYGGDLVGVLEKLDYLDSLGITAIYFNPVFYARSLHKYDATLYHHIDPYFGPNPEADLAIIAREDPGDPATWQWTTADTLFLYLLKEAHRRGIRIIIDGVFNHTGRSFFAFADLMKNQARSPYRDWYIVESFDDPRTPENEFKYKGWWGVATLPEFADTPDGTNLAPGPRRYIFAITRRWMDPNGDGNPSDGIDGWRLDVAEEVPLGFWKEWHALVRSLNPEAYTTAEIWGDASHFIREGGFTATMNYYGFAMPITYGLVQRHMSLAEMARQMDARRRVYTPARQRAMQNLMDSHDTERLATLIVNRGLRNNYDRDNSPRHSGLYDTRKPNAEERRIQRLVALLQMTYIGAPMIYYGTEAGMWGADDPDDRMPMVWPDSTFEPQQRDPRGYLREKDPVAFDHDLFAYYREAIALRQNEPTLQLGDLAFLEAPEDVLFFRRTYRGDTLYMALNGSESSQVLPVSQRVQVLFSSDPAYLRQEDGGLILPPQTGVVFRHER